jgi:hypothetical protein
VRRLSSIAVLFLVTTSQAQVQIECTAGDCVNAVWGESCGGSGNCGAAGPSEGCGGQGSCCNCTRGFLNAQQFFAGSFDRKQPTLFVLDVIPESMTKVGVQRDDVLWSVGVERKAKRRVRSRAEVLRLTPERSPRRLRMTIYRRSTGMWFKATIDQ